MYVYVGSEVGHLQNWTIFTEMTKHDPVRCLKKSKHHKLTAINNSLRICIKFNREALHRTITVSVFLSTATDKQGQRDLRLCNTHSH